MALLPRVPFGSTFALGAGLGSRVADDWHRWFRELAARIDATARVIGAAVALTAQASSVSGATGALPAGLYRVAWLVRVTQAATTSSGLQVSIGATADGLVTAQDGAALASPAAGTVQSGSVLVQVDASTAVAYAVAYSSVGATPLQFAFSMTVEAL